MGRAFVSVDPDAADFDEKLAEQIGSPVVIVRVQADAADVDAQIDEQVGRPTTTVRVDADTGPAREQVDELVSSGLPKDTSFTVGADTSPAQGALGELDGAAQESQAQMEKLERGAAAASQALSSVGGEAGGAAEELSASSPEVQHFGEQFTAVAQEIRDFGEAAGGIAGSTESLDAALGRVGFALEGIHASGAVAVSELIALRGQLADVESELDTMEGAFGTAAGAMDDIGHAAVTSAAQVESSFATATGAVEGLGQAAVTTGAQIDVLNGDLASGGSRDLSGGYYKSVGDDIGGVARESEDAAQAQRDLRGGVDEASQAFTGLTQEMGQLRQGVVGSFGDWSQFEDHVSRLGYDLESLQLSPTAQGLEDIQMRLGDAGRALDGFEQDIPAAVQELGDLGNAASDGRIRTASQDYRDVGQEIADMGGAAVGASGQVEGLASSGEHGFSAFHQFSKVLDTVISSPWTWAAVGAGAIAYLTYEMTTGRTVLEGYTGALQKQYGAVSDNLPGYEHYAQALRTGGQAAQELEHATATIPPAMERFGTSAGHAIQNTHDLTQAQRAAAAQVHDLSGHYSDLESAYHLTYQQAHDLIGASKASGQALTGSGSAAREAMQKIEAYGNANAHAQGPVGQMSHDMEIFGNDTLTASDRIGHLDDMFNRLVGNFVGSQQAQLQVQSDMLTLASNAKQAGAQMGGANQASVTLAQSFYSSIEDIEGAANAMTKNGDSVQQTTSYINDQIQQLSGMTEGNKAAQQAVEGLKTWEDDQYDSTGRLNQALQTASQTLQNQFTAQVKDAGVQSSTAKQDVDNLSTSIKNNGTQSNATKAARAQLIADLEASGVKASTAKTDVDKYIQSLGKIPSKEATSILVTGKGQWSVTESNIYPTPTGKAPPVPIGVIPPKSQGAAAGMLVTGGVPGLDSVPILAQAGEVVVPAHMVKAGAVDHLRGSIPGFASGGVVGGAGVSGSYGGSASATGTWSDSESVATNNAVIYSVEKAMADAINAKIAGAKAAASGAGGPAPQPGGGAPASNAALARKMMPSWASGTQWTDWNNVAMAESGWDNFAQNPSGAYGIPQALPYTKMPKAAWPAAAGGSSDPGSQISWMAGYIQQRYGNPAGAWAHEQKYHWYDQGGWLGPGGVGGNATGSPEAVLTPAESAAIVALGKALVARDDAAAGGQSITQNFYGNSGLPTAEQRQAMRLDLAAAIGVA